MTLKKRKYKKKTDRQKLVKKLDDICRKLVRKRDRGMCVKCGKPGTDTSHVIPRTHKALRWDLQNLKLLCHYCHFYWWHKNPMEAWTWFQREFPWRADYLSGLKYANKKFTVEDLKERLEELEREYES